MFFNADDDDDFSPSLGSGTGGKSNLSSLFGADQAAFNSSKNESLTYTAPKQPKKQTGSAAQDQGGPALLHAAAAQVFKYVNGQYASQGKLGVAVLGSHTKKEYRLLCYASKKQQVTSAKITSAFSFVVQANNYASFYDDARQSWSLRFDAQQAVVDFAKQIGLARYNSAPGSLVKQDLQPGEGQAIESGDVIEVKYTGSLWKNNTFGKVFDTNATADKLFKFRLGKGKVIKGWDDGVVGMKKGTKRLIAIPPDLAYGDKGVQSRVPPKSTLLFEVEVSRVKFSKERTENIPGDTTTSAPPSAHEQSHKDEANSSSSSAHSREDEDLRERTASLSKELSTSPEKGSEKAKLLARMSKMGKNVLKLPGAVAADPNEGEHEPTEAENIESHNSARTQAEPVRDRPRSLSHEQHDQSGNPHPQSPGKPRIAPRSAHVNRVAHANPAPSHVTQTHAPPQYHTEYQSQQPAQTQIPPLSQIPPQPQVPPQPQALALYQTSLQQNPPVYQQPTQYSFPQPQTPFPPVYQQPPQPVFQSAPTVQPQPSSSGGTSDVMMPMLMTESRQYQTEFRQAITKVSEKIDSLDHKIDSLKQTNEENNGAIRPVIPGLSNENVMEASVLMNSIVKLVQDNERMKRENVEKTAKIENLNEKISDLLHRSQRYVEQSNIFLEQRNESLQQSSSYSQSKLVELEREKTTLSTELGAYKQNCATMETELEILRKQDAESRELLKKTSSQLQKNKKELATTKESLQEKEEEVEKLSSSVKSLKQERRKIEGILASLEENVSDVKQEKDSLEKNLTDRKKKHAEVKKRMDEEIEELKSGHEEELNSLRERHRRELTSSSSSLSQQISQLESEMETKWQEKSRQLVSQSEKKWQRKYDDLVEESDTLKKTLSESEEKCSTMKTAQTQLLVQIEDLQEKLKDLDETRAKYLTMKNTQGEKQHEIDELREKVKDIENTQKKYQDLRMRSIEMKEKYEERFQELTKEKEMAMKEVHQKVSEVKQQAAIRGQNTEPSRDKIVNEVKQIMNKVFFKIREEIVADDSYKGSAIIAVVLNVIKTMTLKMTSGDDESGDESEDESGEEESEDEEGEISAKEEGGNEERTNEENNEGESGKVEDEESEDEEGEDEEIDDQSGSDEDKGSAEVQGEKLEVEEHQNVKVVEVEENESGNNVEESGKVDEDKQGEMKNEGETGKQDEEEEGRIDTDDDKQNFEDVNKEDERQQKKERDEKLEENGSDHEINDSDERALRDLEGPSGVSAGTIESPLHRTNYSDEDQEGVATNEAPAEGEPKDTDGHSGTTGYSASSEEDLDIISNRPVLGSEHTSLSSGEEEVDGNTVDNSNEDKDSERPQVSDLPSIGELSNTSQEGIGSNQGGSQEVDDENENTSEMKNKEMEKNKAQRVVDEKAKQEKKVQSLSDLLSDDEDDVQGLFDNPAPKLKSTPAKKESESSSVKAIPPPLFDDDDDDDDLDWFS